MQHRPITVLSTIYRLWSSVRHDQLAKLWQPQWAPAGAYGLKGRPAADSLVFDTCAYLAGAAQEGQVVGGISYDFALTGSRSVSLSTSSAPVVVIIEFVRP